jgi:hypothetical protein
MLRQAFNAVTKLHSRAATIKRLGTVDMYSPARLTPSNYFRFLRGPEHTTVSGHEFIIPVDSLLGQFAQKLTFDVIPSTGDFQLKYLADTTPAIAFNATAADIQVQLRLLTGLSNVLVTGSFLIGFTITFAGIAAEPDLIEVMASTLDAQDTIVRTNIKWPDQMKKGDRILDGTRVFTVDEVIEMHDLGTTVLGFRVRAD